jgi:signal transduction histidine kinase/ActR/RegA family two-component response regulator
MTATTTTLQRRLTIVVLATIALALALSAAALLAYEVYSYRTNAVSELSTQADLVAFTGETALAFDDTKAAGESLALLRLQPQIRSAVVYRPNGTVFAAFSADGRPAPPRDSAPTWVGHRFSGNVLEISRPLTHSGEPVGSLLLQARYDVMGRVVDYLTILAGTMLVSLLLAALVFNPLQRRVLEPVHALSAAAKDVVEGGDYRVRVRKSSDDELGLMVDAFNTMLGEVARRTDDLESANRKLSLQIHQTEHAEQQLRQADRRKDDFLATLAHELRNPMAPIVNAIAVLKIKDLQDPQVRWVRDVIERQVRHMARLVDDLLDVARITRGKIELRLDRMDLGMAVRMALESTQPFIDRQQHEVKVRLSAQPVFVVGDMTRLSQVVANLINNAAKYTPPRGLIEIEVARDGEDAVVSVRDNGAGIAAEHLDAVFEMFTQVESPLSRTAGGLGIGLALARALVSLHGGSVSATSGGPGQGSCFALRIPVEARSSAAEPPTPAVPEAAAHGPAASARVMVVDDNRDAALSLSMMLQLQGFDVREAYDGIQALDQGELYQPAIVLMDIGMPRMNGYEAAERIRQAAWGKGALLVAVTGWGQEQDRDRAKAAGFDLHLTKPIDPAELDRLLRAHPSVRQDERKQPEASPT